MSRVLILDDDQLFCRTLRDGLLLTRELGVTDVDTTNSVDKATLRIIRAVETNSPYDIFLVDQYLGNGTDGIQVMTDLRRVSPSTDAIVFTGMGDPSSGQRAYAAGAARYLQKPFEIDELISIMESLKEWRRVLHERTWMQALIEITEETEKLQDFGQVAAAIVEGALRLGFERSYLLCVPERQPVDGVEMIGMHMAGSYTLPEFTGQHFLTKDSPYALAAMESHDVLFFNKYSQGRGVMEKHYGPERFPPPVGEWACLPLWSNERFSGILVLDNADRDATLSDDQRKLLQLYARQVTAILERARLFGREMHNRQEIQLINQIGKQITVYVNDLDRLLEEIRSQIGRRFRVENFFIALVNEETHKLDFRLQYEAGKRRQRHMRRLYAGLTGHIVQMQSHEPLYLPYGTEAYCQSHAVRAYGKPAKCWVGIPLWVVNRMIGVMAIQHYEREGFYTQSDVDLLAAVADQIAGAIYVARLVELEQARLNLLQQASAELVRLVNENEMWMWRALLNILTASYGLKFNRAWLFLSEAENTRLAGVLSIGQVETEEAHREWERAQRANMTFDRFIELLRGEQLRPTPLEALTKTLEFNAPEEASQVWENILFRVIATNQRVHLNAEEAGRMLPEPFASRFGVGECAVVPLRAGDRCMGLVIVDNRHNGEPVEEEALDRMETFLNTAGLVYLNAQQHAQQQALLNATHAVAGQNEKISLGETLTQVCKAARVVNHAELVTIYPIKDGGPDEFDTSNVGLDGAQRNPGKPVKDKPRQRGMAAFILRGARLIINDLQTDARLIDGERLADHPFNVREGVRAFIGMPVLDQLTAAPLGVLYLNYRKAQRFSAADVQRAETFANLAAIAIRNARSAALGQSSQRELNILQKVLKTALSYPVERVVIQTLLNAINELLQSDQVRCQVILANWETVREGDPPDLVLQSFTGGPDMQVDETDLLSEDRDRVRKAIDGGVMVLCENHLRAFVPIRTGARSLGVLDVFDPDEEISTKRQRTLERIAAIAALALDNARRQMNLVSALKSVKAFTEPASLSDTLVAINEQIRIVSPDISALTIWYMDHHNGMVKRGPTFGVIYQDQMLPNLTPEGSVLTMVLESREPIWAEDVFKEKRLLNQFVYREGIRSVAAFPLRADNIVVGAMFFNYRREHHFTQEERSLFSLLAEIVAASILDSMRLEEKQRESARLEATLSITEAIGTSLDLSQVIDKALAKLGEIMKSQCSPCLLIYKENERVLEFAPESLKYYHVNIPEECGLHFLHLEDQAIAARVARLTLKHHHGHPENIANVEEDPDYRRMITSTRSELCVSLVSGGKLLGVLALESPERNAFDAEEVRQVMGIAQQISLAIERVQQIQRLQFKDTVATATAWATEIAHDINREVGKIRDQVYWIKENLHDSELIRAHLDRIVESSAKLSSVGPLGNMTYKPFHVNADLEHWITNFVETSEAEIAVKFEFGEDLVIQANTIGLERVLRHLVRNAVQAMKEGGTLTVRTLISPHDKSLEIQIQDSGPGIDEAVRQQLFQHPVTTKEGRGGFGLLLVRQIIEGMNGLIWIKPQEPGRGAIFCIRLPIEEQGPDENASHDGTDKKLATEPPVQEAGPEVAE